MRRQSGKVSRAVAMLCLVALATASPDPPASKAAESCAPGWTQDGAPWARERRMTVLVDSVLLGAYPTLSGQMRCWRLTRFGRPALMVRAAEQRLRAEGRRVGPLVVVGLGYNSIWQRKRARYRHWAARFDSDARRLLATLRRLGAKQFVWVTLREPAREVVPPRGRREFERYAWYFPYVNERLHRLDRRRDDVVLADWAAVSNRPGITYDSIHVNPRGARLMARTIQRAVRREARPPRGVFDGD